MKVYLGPYRNWFGPYQLAELIPFISEDTQYKIGDWLCKYTPIEKFLYWVDDLRGPRKIQVRIDKYDTWGMDHTLALMIVPMLKQLRDNKHGAPYSDLEDVPEHMRYEDTEDSNTQWIQHRWDWILNEMIWTFEQVLDHEWESQYTIQEGEIDFDDYPEDEGKEFTPMRWKKEYIVNWEGRKAHQARIDNGLKLFGKYYQALWD